jgi:DNA-binding NtrC family response regulator
LELCENGTIFLDEITEMPQRLQFKLIQVLQNGRFTPSGGFKAVNAGVRIVAASSMSIDQALSERRLLAELSHQLSAYELHVPPLRARRSEIPVLSRHFMHRLARRYNLPPRKFAPPVGEAWQAHEWPGNLRELEQSVKRYLILGDEEFGFQKDSANRDEETREAASGGLRTAGGSAPTRRAGGICGHKSLRSLLQSVKEEAERAAIVMALEQTGWNRKAAARLLKTSYRTVLYKIEQYRLSAPEFSPLSAARGVGPKKAQFRDSSHADAQV